MANSNGTSPAVLQGLRLEGTCTCGCLWKVTSSRERTGPQHLCLPRELPGTCWVLSKCADMDQGRMHLLRAISSSCLRPLSVTPGYWAIRFYYRVHNILGWNLSFLGSYFPESVSFQSPSLVFSSSILSAWGSEGTAKHLLSQGVASRRLFGKFCETSDGLRRRDPIREPQSVVAMDTGRAPCCAPPGTPVLLHLS